MKKFLFLLMLTPLLLLAQPRVSLQVLGSGGPESGDKRASSGYIVWVDGKSRVLVDFGGGASLRFEEVGAKIEDLEVILLTHLHIDHTADLPALLKSSFFIDRKRDLLLFGPDRNRIMPDTHSFIERLFKNRSGAWQYMGDYLDGRADFQLKEKNIAKSITFSGDMNGEYHTLEKLAKGTDLLVAHNAVPKGARGVGAELHMTPFTIGQIAKTAKIKKMVLSHRMLRTLGREKETVREIRKNYKGSVKFANDKSFYRVK